MGKQLVISSDALSNCDHFAPHEVALLLGVESSTVHQLMNCGEMPYFMYNGRRRIHREAVLLFVIDHEEILAEAQFELAADSA